ncbi:YciI family protein [Paraclostridium sordellii]|uniref:YciI-like protein n=1 Tax=Paraclostridium sordellii TaxID=1505 RepID=A0A9P1P8V7_PARSO|nr:YciI family protein [Paeniclostridium sordellii]CEO25660.1 YciI-like protein [[Clostridium] sordellii] [Paeniclostridium sordellii]CEO32434.1 YciI-like protein [[Clostridium] sordellii] [Paeniclostridium sordellii]
MKYFIVEGILKSTNKIDKDTMTKHMNYSQKAMDEGLILMSGLKENMSGGIFIMKSDSIENIKEYLDNEPFKLEGIQDYKIVEFSPHYFNESPGEWFK